MTRELLLQQHSWHSKSDTAKIKSALWEYLVVRVRLKYTAGPVASQALFFSWNTSKKMRESYLVKHDVLQSVLPWFICFGCGNNTQFPVYSLIISQWRISHFLVIIWGWKKIPGTCPDRTTPYWLSKGKTEISESGAGCLIQSLFVPINLIVLWIQPFIPSSFKGLCDLLGFWVLEVYPSAICQGFVT